MVQRSGSAFSIDGDSSSGVASKILKITHINFSQAQTRALNSIIADLIEHPDDVMELWDTHAAIVERRQARPAIDTDAKQFTSWKGTLAGLPLTW